MVERYAQDPLRGAPSVPPQTDRTNGVQPSARDDCLPICRIPLRIATPYPDLFSFPQLLPLFVSVAFASWAFHLEGRRAAHNLNSGYTRSAPPSPACPRRYLAQRPQPGADSITRALAPASLKPTTLFFHIGGPVLKQTRRRCHGICKCIYRIPCTSVFTSRGIQINGFNFFFPEWSCARKSRASATVHWRELFGLPCISAVRGA